MAAYFIFNHKVLDSETLNNDYLPKAVETLKPYNPEILVVDQNAELVEGQTEDHRMVEPLAKQARRAAFRLIWGCCGGTGPPPREYHVLSRNTA